MPEHGVTTVFVNTAAGNNKHDTKIELLHPFGQDSPIANFLKKQPGGGVHHICIEVDDLQSAMKHVQQEGVRVLPGAGKLGAHGKPVAFLHPKDCGNVLIELESAAE